MSSEHETSRIVVGVVVGMIRLWLVFMVAVGGALQLVAHSSRVDRNAKLLRPGSGRPT